MRLGRAFVIAALAAATVLAPLSSAWGQSSVNGSNSSDGTSASSGGAKGSNSTNAFTGEQSGGGTNAGTQDTSNVNGTNVQEGTNRTTINQTTNVKTGSAIAGQVIGGVVGAGGTLTINASNKSENVDVTTGDADGSNSASTFTGLAAPFAGLALENNSDANTSDLNNIVAKNIQEGDNRTTVRQSVTSTSGEGIAGQVIGAAVGAGGSADIAAKNETTNSSVDTGDADGSNSVAAFTGLLATTGTANIGLSDINGPTFGVNVQEGDNRFIGTQSAHTQTGDGIAGQVLGVSGGGHTTLDASNKTTNSDVTTGSGDSDNSGAAFTGLASATAVDVGLSDVNGVNGTNIQEGDNTSRLTQTADSVTGDAIAGQVAGVTTSAGGSAKVTLANESDNIDAQSGESNFSNLQKIFNGLSTTSGELTVSDALGNIFKSALS
jgi:hypothetical protein